MSKTAKFTNGSYKDQQGNDKKSSAILGRFIANTDQNGNQREAIACRCSDVIAFAAMAQAKLNNGEDTIWLNVYEDKQQNQQPPQQYQQTHAQQQAPQQYQQPPQSQYGGDDLAF